MAAITKSEGLTASERYLKGLCERSFLSLWSYPNLFRDQGGGHELCDLLVVFGDDVIIFSDKSCAFPRTGKLETDWSRWYRRSVRDSAKQVFGAERWIRRHPDRVFLDQACTRPFPLDLSKPERFWFHRIVVAIGATDRCREELGGSGSLMLTPKMSDGQSPDDRFPFTVGWVFTEKPYVHVFDDVTLDILLGELDTVSDFTAYLRKKEDFIGKGHLGSAAGEEDLLAAYLRTMNAAEEHDFPRPGDADIVYFDESGWRSLMSRPEFLARRERDAVSYTWDRLIEVFAKPIADGSLAFGQELGVQAHERGVRVMAAEGRLGRRVLADLLLDLLAKTSLQGTNARLVLSRQRPDVGYVLLLTSPIEYSDYDEYRKNRSTRLSAYGFVAKYLYPALQDIVGIGTEPTGNNGSSQDLFYFDAREWSAEDAEKARRLHEDVGLFKNMRVSNHSEKEFPVGVGRFTPDQARRARNRRKQDARRARERGTRNK